MVLMLWRALSTTRGLAWKAMPSPASEIIGRSLAPSPTAMVCARFTFFGEYLQRRYGIDYVYANELEVGEDGKLTGRYVGEIVDGRRKAELLKLIAQVEKVNLAQTIAVGDGANDLPMISEAGLGIAFHAKPRVKESARQSLSTIGLDGVLYFLGFKDSYLGEQGRMV